MRLLNGGANRANPYSADEHMATGRWQGGQAVRERLQNGEAIGRILIGEAALRNFGGGQEGTDQSIQRDAILYIAGSAMDGIDIRVAPFSVDQRGAATDEVMVASLADGRTGVVEWRLKDCRFEEIPELVENVTNNFEHMWRQSLEGDARDAYLLEIAEWLR